MRKLLTILCLLGFVGCTQSKDCGYVKNIQGNRVSWKSKLPIQLRLHTSFPAENIDELKAAINVWNTERGETLFVLDTTKRVEGAEARKDGVNAVYFAHSWEPEKSYEQAKTSVYWREDKIEEADVRVNAADFKFFKSGASIRGRQLAGHDQSPAVHLQSLLVHELGHVLGLKHNDQKPSVMATFLRNNAVRVDLTSEDKTALLCEY